MSKKEGKEDDSEDTKEYVANPSELDGVPDLSQLIYLEMKHVLHNLHHRYSKMPRKYCYTSISTILVAINPYERLPIYGRDVIDQFHEAAKQWRLPQGRPHPYGVSARSYMRMIQRKTNQSVIVCGESGAGKTETTKLLMRYLAMTSPSKSMETSIIEQQIIAASPILEAFGNAKTVMNNNSSRFGKFTKLLYDVPEKAREGHILGSWLETYLLEKSRVVRQATNERNYHIFYFLHKGLDKKSFAELKLSDCNDFWYTNQGNSVEVAGINDKERYVELVDSLKLMRIENEQDDLWRLVAGILHLGNVEFQRQGDGFASIKNPDVVATVAELWSVTPEALSKRLTTKSLKMPGNKIITQNLTFDNAPTNRDSIAKGFYEQCFLWLGDRINAELYDTDKEDMDSLLFIGILDVFGFENFYINSLEQFCINFTNEKLQQFFNFHIIRSEQEEYIKESVFWTPLSIPDNLAYIEMVESGKYGFFSILDSACRAPQPDVQAFMNELFKHHKKNPTIHECKEAGHGNARGKPKKTRRRGPRSKFLGFLVHHFADDVSYDAQNFLVKNMEAVHPDTAKMLAKSKNILVTQIGTFGTKGRKRNKLSVTGTFHKGIKTLMKNLRLTEPFFVRCVNPNMIKSSTEWTEHVVEGQLRCGGLVEALKVLKLGYPTRVPYKLLYDKYHGNVTNPLIKNMGPESFSTALLIAFDVEEDHYELGLTKIFFKPARAAVLDTIMSQAGKPLSVEQNRKITRWVVGKRIKQMVGTCKSFLMLRQIVRMARAAKRWHHAGRVSSILAYSVGRHLRMAREQILERKRQQGAAAMQAYWRAAHERIGYRNHMEKVHKAIQVVWISYRRWNERNMLKEWLDVRVEESRKRKAEEERKRREEEARLAAEMARQAKEEQERLAKLAREEQERRLREEAAKRRREEQERLAREEEERRKAKEEEERKRKEEEERKARELEQARELEMKRQEQAKMDAEKARLEAERLERERQKEQRDSAISMKKKARREEEESRRDKARQKKRRMMFPEDEDDEEDRDADGGSDGEQYDDGYYDEPETESLAKKLERFPRIAAVGTYFSKYTGKRRRKPQDRVVKVSFDDRGKPLRIAWGGGSRHIDFKHILFIAWGHWTPVFESRKDTLNPETCFSVVGRDQSLDVKADSKMTAELWVKGLRRLIGQSDEEADELSKQHMTNQTDRKERGKKAKREAKQRTKERNSLMQLQQDLFIMTTTTVFRQLEEERIWILDQEVRDMFRPQPMYEEALARDIPWRSWSEWIRDKVTRYLLDHGLVHQDEGVVGAPSLGLGVGASDPMGLGMGVLPPVPHRSSARGSRAFGGPPSASPARNSRLAPHLQKRNSRRVVSHASAIAPMDPMDQVHPALLAADLDPRTSARIAAAVAPADGTNPDQEQCAMM